MTEEQKILATNSIIINSRHIIHGSSADFQSLDMLSELPVKKKKRQYTQRLPKQNNKCQGSGGKKNVAVKPKRNIASNVSNRARSNVIMPTRDMQTVTNVTQATSTNPCNCNAISICGRGQGVSRGTVFQSSNFKVQQMEPVKAVGGLNLSTHKFQASNKAT